MVVLVMTSPSNPKRCQICGRISNNLTETIEKKYSPNVDGRIFVCSQCFRLLVSDKHDELEILIGKKLRGEENATN